MPVGEACRLALANDPSRVQHSADGSHHNGKGSYLAAAVFFSKVFGESPVGNTFTAGLPAPEVAYLQGSAAPTI